MISKETPSNLDADPTEEKLKASEQRFRDVVSSIPGAVYQFVQRGDGAFEMPFMSKGAEILFGRPLSELMDTSHFLDDVHPDDVQPFLDSIQVSAQNMSDWRLDFRIILKDGSIRWLRGASSPKPLPDGGVCWSGILTDVTDIKRVERDLENINKDLRMAQVMAGVGNWSLDPEVGVPVWSDQVYAIYERDPKEGPHPLADYQHIYRGKYWERFHAAISAAINHGTPYDIELKLELPSGKVKWVRAICEPDPCPGPKGRFLRGTVQEITTVKQAEDALQEKNATIVSILENTDDIICFRDRQGRLKYYNTAFARIVRKLFNIEPFIGMRTMDYLPGEARRQWRPILERVLAGQRYVGQFQWAFGEDDVRVYEIAYNPVQKEGEIIGYSEFNRDITAQKQAEERIRRAKEKAEAANRAKSEFLANMSHEIRTPINSMLGFIQILKDQQIGPLNPTQDEYLDYIIQSSQRLLVLINDILDLSRVEAGKLTLAPASFDFHRLMDRMDQFLVSLAAPKPIQTRIDVDSNIPSHVIGDVHRIEQILKNLIGNAVKFTEQGEIEVWVENQEEGQFLFQVSDTGVGIPQEKQGQLFTKFYQADSSYAKQFAGAGLGLAITKELVEMMKGDIWVESKVGQGSVFYVALPLERADDSCVDYHDRASSGLHVDHSVKRCLKILLAEDDQLNRQSAVYFLEKDGHAVTTASNGKAVLTALATDSFDIILMDVQMPEMDGIEAIRRIRGASGVHFDPRIPIIALTAYAMNGDKKYFLRAGADDYVSKPIDYQALLKKINQLVARGPADASIAEQKPPAVDDSIRELDQFMAQTQEHPEFALEMMRGFMDEAPIRQKNLHAGFKEKDLTLIAAMAHKMANLFASLQLFTLGHLSNEMEGAARAEKFEKCRDCLAQLDSGLDSLTAHIKAARYLEDK